MKKIQFLIVKKWFKIFIKTLKLKIILKTNFKKI